MRYKKNDYNKAHSTALIHCCTPMVGTAWSVIGLCFEMNAGQAVWHSRGMLCADAEDHCAHCEALHIAKGTWVELYEHTFGGHR